MEKELSKRDQQLLILYYQKRKKKRKIILIVLGILIFFSFLLYGVFSIWEQTNWKLQQTELHIEYGNVYQRELDELIDFNANPDLKDRVVIECEIPNEKDKNYPAIGEYEAKIIYTIDVPFFNNEVDSTKKYRIIVKDTTVPEIKILDEIEVVEGTDIGSIDLSSYFEINDKSEYQYKIDTSNVDVNIPNEYEIIVKAIDNYKNENSISIPFKVIAKPKQTQPQQETDKTEDPLPPTQQGEKADNEVTTKLETKNDFPNKDFLFVDGYTMSNVAEAARAYMQSSGKSGKAIPIQDENGIYLGMRVIFDE